MDSPKELGWFFSLPLCPHAKPNESIWIAKDMPVGEATKVLSKTPASIAADRQTKGKVADLGSVYTPRVMVKYAVGFLVDKI